MKRNWTSKLQPVFNWSGWNSFTACLNSSVTGHPRWCARYVEAGLCRIKWVVTACIILWAIQGFALTHAALGDFLAAAQFLDRENPANTARFLIFASLSVGLVSAFITILSRRQLTLTEAQWLVSIIALGTVAPAALILGFSHLTFSRVISYDLSLLVLLAIAPLKLTRLILVSFTSIAFVIIAAKFTGNSITLSQAIFFTHPLSFAVLGIVVNQWQQRAFKAEWLSGIRLKRRTRQLEKQKIEIERQRDESERQRIEIESQSKQLFQALSSALTSPVALAYHNNKTFKPELKTVCVIACDAVGFSQTCRQLQPDRVVLELENFFRGFDSACLKYRIEPLRAQGDSRIAISGLWPDKHQGLHHTAINAILAMLAFKRFLPEFDAGSGQFQGGQVLWPARIGISLGSASCGIIDTAPQKNNLPAAFSASGTAGYPISEAFMGTADNTIASPDMTPGRLWFDVWGDTVNVAARLEQGAQPNQILVRESVLWETRGLFDHGPIQPLHIKATVIPDVAEITGIREPYRDINGQPNDAFWQVYNDLQVRPSRPNPLGSASSIPAPAKEIQE